MMKGGTFYDKENNLLYNYYYQRGRGILHCRVEDILVFTEDNMDNQ